MQLLLWMIFAGTFIKGLAEWGLNPRTSVGKLDLGN